ncbi:MAG: acyl-CoA dehydrogenase family protein [Hyphomicrobiaceae bacterium]
MSFERLTSEEQAIVDTVARFVTRDVAPAVAKHEREGTYPDALVAAMKELGLFGVAVPETYGGLGLSQPAAAAVFETLSQGWSSLAAYINSHSTVAYAISRYGSEAQKSQWLPKLATGEVRAAMCLTEPHAGSDLQAIETKAEPAGGGLALSGNKIYVTNGGRADLLMVLAKTDRAAAKPSQSMSLLLVPKTAPGLAVGGTYRKMGFHLVDTVEIRFEQAKLGADAVLGDQIGKGFAQLMESLEVGRIAIAASAVGVAAASLKAAMQFASERKAFGKPIDQHQAIELRLAEMATKLLAARQVTLLAAETKQAGGRADMVSAMAKLYASEAAAEITQDAIRVHGGHGYIADYQVERLHREALLYLVGEGTNDINKLVIARRLREGRETSLLGLV